MNAPPVGTEPSKPVISSPEYPRGDKRFELLEVAMIGVECDRCA